MSFLRAARAALASRRCFFRILVAMVVVVVPAGLSLSCGKGSFVASKGTNHNAYATLPAAGSVLLLKISGATGAITVGGQTPQVGDTSPTGLALLPSKTFLYAVNSSARANSISVFKVASDGTLTLSGTPTPVSGLSPYAAVIDPTGEFLLVTNTLGNNNNQGSVSVFSIGDSGALSEVTPGSPFPANANPTEILITPSGKFVYVTNPIIGTVTAFSFSNGVLTQVPGSPFSSIPGGGGGAFGLVVDRSERFLYVTNPSASNPPPNTTNGNISGFTIDSNSGTLTPISGSPFAVTNGTGPGPTAITVDPGGKFLYATTAGFIWCFTIDSVDGHLVAVANSPFSLSAGVVFALIDPSGNYFYSGTPTGIAGYTYSSSTGVPTAIAGSPFSNLTTPATAPGKMVLSE